jgi:3'-phosphoadenosine 5'-phosphosulfate sulfotransferase (PAPS reductase)/FAD synthetase
VTPIVLPEHLAGLPLVLSISGGKDSTACSLALLEAGLEHRRVFSDTGWEAPETYEHLDELRRKLGPIDVVRAKPQGPDVTVGAMIDRIRHRAGFPARMQRWCTVELKVEPIRRYHDALGEDTVSVVGIRADESDTRARMVEVEDDHEWGGWIWRPMLRWTIADVLAIHHRHDVPVNPLYKRGHERVGCYPCIYSRKEEVRLIAEHSPDRIDQIRDLERYCGEERARRNAVEPGRYAHPIASFFQTRQRMNSGAMTIDDVVAWSRTSHGGKQLPLLPEPPSGGCFRWGMCEKPPTEPTE